MTIVVLSLCDWVDRARSGSGREAAGRGGSRGPGRELQAADGGPRSVALTGGGGARGRLRLRRRAGAPCASRSARRPWLAAARRLRRRFRSSSPRRWPTGCGTAIRSTPSRVRSGPTESSPDRCRPGVSGPNRSTPRTWPQSLRWLLSVLEFRAFDLPTPPLHAGQRRRSRRGDEHAGGRVHGPGGPRSRSGSPLGGAGLARPVGPDLRAALVLITGLLWRSPRARTSSATRRTG